MNDMDRERHQRVSDLFHQAHRLKGAARAQFLDSVREAGGELGDELAELLAEADAHPGFLEQPAVDPQQWETIAGDSLVGDSDAPPEWIGPYRIVRRLGMGGLGVVCLGEQQTPIRRQVAIKLVKQGMHTRDVLSRFEREQRALALMNHPHIAHVYDSGHTANNQPYFVMEYVPGQPITEYCDRERLTMPQRLKLFVTVCQAVQHAHQKGIIHRDIKPSNVLVTLAEGEPTPKVIDFGIAKAMDGTLSDETLHTGVGHVVGTIGYMSPEQADPSVQDLDTRTDVYALGMLLYELLTSTTPFDKTSLRQAALAMMQRIICEEEPPKPSLRLSQLGEQSTSIASQRRTDARTLSRQLRADLDWVVMKALEKDRSRRYASASELAADVARYLEGEPLMAGPPTLAYRLSKFARRHKKLVGTVAATFVVLVGGIISTGFALRRAWAAEERIAITYDNTISFMTAFHGITVGAVAARQNENCNAQLREAMQAASEAPTPRTKLQAYELLGQLLVWVVEDFEAAREVFHVGVMAARDEHLLGSRGGVTLLNNWGNTCMWTGQYENAIRAHEELIVARQAVETDPRQVWARDLNNLSYSLEHAGRHDEAITRQREALTLRRQISETGDPSVAFLLERLGRLLITAERHAEAISVLREALDITGPDRELRADKWSAAAVSLAAALSHTDRFAEADDMLEQAWERAGASDPVDSERQAEVAEVAASLFETGDSPTAKPPEHVRSKWLARLKNADLPR